MPQPPAARSVRPYQLACLICRAGSQQPCQNDSVAELATQVKQNPDLPLAVCCNTSELFAYQNPGADADTPESPEFNIKRDFDLLQWLDLAPGSVLPARVLLKRLLLRVPSVAKICDSETARGEAWRGCPLASSGDYERGHALGIEALIPPRPKTEMESEKDYSIAHLREAEVVAIRPHILLCAVCQYGGGTRPPFKEDNLPEFLQMVMQPGCALKVKLVPGADWDMCAPCPNRSTEGCCICGRIATGGLYNEVKDINTLQALGLTYGTVMNAREMYRLIFELIPTASGVCALNTIELPEYSVWRDGCSSMTFPGSYEKGRDMLQEHFARD